MKNLSRVEIRSLTVATAARKLRTGQLSPGDLVESLLRRIDDTEPSIKAYITVCRDSALKLAKAAEVQLKAGYDLGPLHGIPISVKDLIETKGVRTTAGSKLFAQHVPKEDATVMKRLKAAGAILVGKTNTHEFALGGVTPPTRNPWDLECIPGGSSGGSAAAIAASSALAALGTDTGGSIRIPAAYCGVVGLKPTYGRVSRAGVFPESWSLDHVGPITKTVEDCALLMNAISGFDIGDSTSSRRPVPDFTTAFRDLARDGAAAADDGGLDGLRIGIPENYFLDLLESDVRGRFGDAVKLLEKLGAKTSEFKFPMVDEIMGAYTAIDAAECSAYHDGHFRERMEDYQPDVRAYIEPGFFLTAVQYIKAQRIRGQVMPKVLDVFRRFHTIITPTQPNVAPRQGVSRLMMDGVDEDLLLAMVRTAAPFNLTGLPALSVPCGFSSKGLPVGLQIIGKPFDEMSVLRVGGSYERKTRWHLDRPSAV